MVDYLTRWLDKTKTGLAVVSYDARLEEIQFQLKEGATLTAKGCVAMDLGSHLSLPKGLVALLNEEILDEFGYQVFFKKEAIVEISLWGSDEDCGVYTGQEGLSQFLTGWIGTYEEKREELVNSQDASEQALCAYYEQILAQLMPMLCASQVGGSAQLNPYEKMKEEKAKKEGVR